MGGPVAYGAALSSPPVDHVRSPALNRMSFERVFHPVNPRVTPVQGVITQVNGGRGGAPDSGERLLIGSEV